jgi:capsular exopolysaccharide synthesis family protein
MVPESTTLQSQPVFRAAVRRAWLIILCAVVAGLAALFYARAETKKYTAGASLLFQQSEFTQDLFGYSASQSVDPTTQQATSISLASEPVISSLTAKRLGGGLTFTTVSSAVSVAAENEGAVVNVLATTTSPSLSARLANVYSREVIRYLQQQNEGQVAQAESSLRRQLAALAPDSPERGALTQRLGQLQALASLETPGVQVVGQALAPSDPSSPHPSRDAGLGVVVGVIIGLAGAVFFERRDKRLRDMGEVIDELQPLPLLGVIPTAGRGTAAQGTGGADGSWFAESFRLLRAQLRYFGGAGGLKSVVITSPSPGDGKSTVAWNLAKTYAEAVPSASVLLIDADLRKGAIGRLAGLSNQNGLAEVLSGVCTFADAVAEVPVTSREDGTVDSRLYVLGRGGLPPNPTQLLERAAFAEMLAVVEREFDFVVIDTAPVAQVSDAIPALRLVTGVIVVVRLKSTHRAALRVLLSQLRGLQAPIIGAVINGISDDESGYGGRRYGSYYDAPDLTVAPVPNGPSPQDVDPLES